MMFDIAQDLTNEDTRKISFLATKIAKSKREKVTSALDLFSLLEESKVVTVMNLDRLREYLLTLNRRDLIDKLNIFCG